MYAALTALDLRCRLLHCLMQCVPAPALRLPLQVHPFDVGDVLVLNGQ